MDGPLGRRSARRKGGNREMIDEGKRNGDDRDVARKKFGWG